MGHQAEPGPITLTFEAQDIGGLRSEILRKIMELQGCTIEMQRYLNVRVRLSDWHGVMDASADIRELSAKSEALRGVLEALKRLRR